MHLFKIEKLIVVQGDDHEERRWRKEVLERLEGISTALTGLERTLVSQYDQLKEASDEQKAELATLATSIEDLITRLSDNPTPEQIADIVTSMRGTSAGLRTASGTISTLDPAAGDEPPPPVDNP